MKPDEYLDEESGLAYCSVCHTPRELSIVLLDHPERVSVLCQCQREARDRETAKHQEEEQQRLVARLRRDGLRDGLQRCRFENDKGYVPQIKLAKRYVLQWNEMRRNNTGLLLWGNVGTGKTFMAACVANALIDRGIPVLMTNSGQLLNDMAGIYPSQRSEYIESLNSYELLILDDLGMERDSSYATEQLFSIIDSRYRKQKPILVTTNLSLSQLKEPDNLAHRRIYDRILEMCVPILVDGEDIRRLQGAAKFQQIRALLGVGT